MGATFSDHQEQIDLCEEIYQAPKQIDGDLEWFVENGAWLIYHEFDLKSYGERLLLVGEYRPDEYEVYLALKFRRKFPIRKLHFHFDHSNPMECPTCPGETMSGLHKHYPTPEFLQQATCAYWPDDVESYNPNDMLRAFLEECNITHNGRYEDLLT